MQKVRYYLANPHQGDRMAAAGQRRTLREHLYSHRIQAMVSLLEQNGITGQGRQTPEISVKAAPETHLADRREPIEYTKGMSGTVKQTRSALNPFRRGTDGPVFERGRRSEGFGSCAIATIEAQPEAAAVSPATLRLPLEALDGGELILLAIKPSVFSPLFNSARWGVALTVLALGILWSGTSPMGLTAERAAQVCLGVALVRLMYAVVQWSATWYVLTNRRLLEIHGIRAPRVTSTPLVEIRNTYMSAGLHEKLLNLGTITFVTQHEDRAPWSWRHIQRCEEVHGRIRRAIENALDLMPHA